MFIVTSSAYGCMKQGKQEIEHNLVLTQRKAYLILLEAGLDFHILQQDVVAPAEAVPRPVILNRRMVHVFSRQLCFILYNMRTYDIFVAGLGHHGLSVKTLRFEGDGFVAFCGLLHHGDTVACRTTNRVKSLAKTTTTNT